jgi:hypothetical protein
MSEVKIVSFSSHHVKRGKKPYTVWAGYSFEGAFASMREAEEHAKGLTTSSHGEPKHHQRDNPSDS